MGNRVVAYKLGNKKRDMEIKKGTGRNTRASKLPDVILFSIVGGGNHIFYQEK